VADFVTSALLSGGEFRTVRCMIASRNGVPPADCDVAVVGGGFYGLRIAALMAGAGRPTALFERSPRFLSRASFHNQARIHGGYHYPRSVLTAVRARRLYARFHQEFAAALGGDFKHVYAIARRQTLVGAREFAEFCRRIGAPLSPAPRAFASHFDDNVVEQTFLAEEGVFDAHKLADIVLAGAVGAGAQCVPGVEVMGVEPGVARRLRVKWRIGEETGATEADWIINASYASLNDILAGSGLESIPLIHEFIEIAIVHPPTALQGYGVTVMDGPFWSCIPFPPLNAYSLTHVRYTPHARWRSTDDDAAMKGQSTPRTSHATLMRRDAERFLPVMRDARYVTSLWDTKTVLPRSDGDDGRPILVRRHIDAPGLVSVLGGKIDSVYDVEDELRDLILPA
jgi:glycine/D-amino acid oxidase-like deaminating enzyme